ncbi:hypothetical protein [Streptomyces sp. NPDC017993]|uniref:hypothetical protein n=1 Tax=Streptomyces sp. NPDC017993 TaxID=3365027 RepID=UPI0037A98B7C
MSSSAQGGRSPARGQGAKRPDIEFRPVRNGMDYLLSAVTHLTEGKQPPDDRDLKYAVLHLHAATEVLLKARLVREHWSLVISDVRKATEKKFHDGDFSSVTVEATIERLRDIVGLDIGQENRTAITNLTKTRNAFTHYGHTAEAYAVETQITLVLDFLLDFIPTHLYDPQPTSQFGAEYMDTMERIQERLGRIDSLVKARMRNVNATLKDMADRTVQCPHCRQYAVAIPEGTDQAEDQVLGPELRCLFCNAQWPACELARLYVLDVIGPDDGQLQPCGCSGYAPWADEPSLVLGASTAAEPDAFMGLCFRCGARYHRKPSKVSAWSESEDSATTGL